MSNTYLEASPDLCASAHKLPETALDIFNQCNGFNFFAWLVLEVAPRDNKLFPFVPGGIEGGGGDGNPGKLLFLLPLGKTELDKLAGLLGECRGGGGAEGTEGGFLVVAGPGGGGGAGKVG